MFNDFCVGFFCIGLLLGLIAGGCLLNYSFDKRLQMAGIDRLEKCHNTQSNWVEIVWLKK